MCLGVVAITVVLAACDGIGPGQAKSRFCVALAKLGESMVETASVDASSTSVDKLYSQRSDLGKRFKRVESTATAISAAHIDVVTLTYNRMVGVINSVTNEATFAQSAAAIRNAVEQFGAASAQNREAVGCPS